MNKTLISSLFIGITALSTSAFSDVIVDPITGVVNDSVATVNNVINGNFLFVGNNQTVAPAMVTVRPGIFNNDLYVIKNINSGTTITDYNTGRTYLITGVKYGTMDVNDGNGITRYQYDTFYVKPL